MRKRRLNHTRRDGRADQEGRKHHRNGYLVVLLSKDPLPPCHRESSVIAETSR